MQKNRQRLVRAGGEQASRLDVATPLGVEDETEGTENPQDFLP